MFVINIFTIPYAECKNEFSDLFVIYYNTYGGCFVLIPICHLTRSRFFFRELVSGSDDLMKSRILLTRCRKTQDMGKTVGLRGSFTFDHIHVYTK